MYLVILKKTKNQKYSAVYRFWEAGTTTEVSWFPGYFQALRIKQEGEPIAYEKTDEQKTS